MSVFTYYTSCLFEICLLSGDEGGVGGVVEQDAPTV